MINLEKISDLINQIPDIKSCFSTQSAVLATSYNFKEDTRINHSMQIKTIYKHPDFISWRASLEYELNQLKQDQLILDILKLFKRFKGWSDDSLFSELEVKLLILQEHLSEYKEITEQSIEIDDLRIPERELEEKILGALCKLQKNAHYDASDSEDTMNDFVRDMLSNTYEVKDQTRQGSSTRGNDAGEIDIQICHSGLPVVMVEGIKLDSVRSTDLNTHVSKVLTNYDPNGCPYAVIIVYSVMDRFDSFYKRLFNHLKEYEYPYPKKTELTNIDTIYSEIKHAQIVLERNNQNVLVHFYAVHIC